MKIWKKNPSVKNWKNRYLLMQIFAILGFLLWVVETTYFCIQYGWHWKAINEAEELWDGIVVLLFTICLVLFYSILIDIIKLFVFANINHVNIKYKKED
jgi:hypothetical protein